MVLTTAKMGSHQQMTAREKDIYDTYSEDLETLTFNSKPVINSMTELANEYSSDFAHIIVRCIEDKIKMVETTQKLPLLYLLDSILKNHTRPYHDLLQQNIVSIFAHVFQYVQRDQAAKVRSALHKLRLTWTDNYFSLTKLNQLDRKIQTLDPNWPIIPSNKAALENNTKPDLPNPSLRTSGQSIHINPAVFGRQPSLSTESDLDAQYKQKQIELMELKLETMRKQLSAQKDMQAIDEKQQPAVKPSFQSTSFQVCTIRNPSVFISILSRGNNLQRPMSKCSTIHWHLRLYFTTIFQITRNFYPTYIKIKICRNSLKSKLQDYPGI